MIDLHSHTTASDGQYAPRELLSLARAAGVTTLAVTDHDTVGGLSSAREAAREMGVELVCGIELSAFIDRREVHVLGHFVRPDEPELAHFSHLLRDERRTRMEQMVLKMRGLGFPVDMADVDAIANGAHLGRPHLARALVEKRICLDTKEAFDRFLADGKPAWVDRYRLGAVDAIRLIKKAGGAATLAHPAVSKVDKNQIAQLRDAGLSGLEVYHSDHQGETRKKLLDIAEDLKLIATAGSDFHGEKVAPNRKLGTASMDAAAFEALRAASSNPGVRA
jgi:predicted metal-dependent phosphoesterase TrpH